MSDQTDPPLTDQDIKVLEIKAGVKKVVYGTAIVGVAAAFFPFAQQTATEVVQFASNERTQDRLTRENTRIFLESLSDEGRSPNLDERIVLAEYYRYLSERDEAARWEEFLNHLYAQRDAQRAAELAAVKVATDSTATQQDRALAFTTADQLRQSSDPDGTSVSALPKSVQDLLSSLESDDTGVRRGAREALARLGTEVVPIAARELADKEASYRKQLGLLVGLTLMMRENKSQRSAIIDMITAPQLANLLEFAIDADRTIRIHAGEFLFDLGDPRVFALTPDLWQKAADDNGRFNLALVMKGAAPHLAREDVGEARALLSGYLGVVGPLTDKELNGALTLLPD